MSERPTNGQNHRFPATFQLSQLFRPRTFSRLFTRVSRGTVKPGDPRHSPPSLGVGKRRENDTRKNVTGPTRSTTPPTPRRGFSRFSPDCRQSTGPPQFRRVSRVSLVRLPRRRGRHRKTPPEANHDASVARTSSLGPFDAPRSVAGKPGKPCFK